MKFARNVCLVIRQLLGKIDHLAADHPAGTTGERKQKNNDQQHCRNTSNPTFHSHDKAREQEGDQGCERQGYEHGAAEIERGHDKSEEQDRPDAFERASRRGSAVACGHARSIGRLSVGLIQRCLSKLSVKSRAYFEVDGTLPSEDRRLSFETCIIRFR